VRRCGQCDQSVLLLGVFFGNFLKSCQKSKGYAQTVYSGPDFGAGVDENLYKVRKSREEEPLREEKREASETLSMCLSPSFCFSTELISLGGYDIGIAEVLCDNFLKQAQNNAVVTLIDKNGPGVGFEPTTSASFL
jgi:hypothetical protein